MFAAGYDVEQGYTKRGAGPRETPPTGALGDGEDDGADEPEPAPSHRRPTPVVRCGALLATQVSREAAASWQLCQLAAELADMTSPWASCAPFFAKLAEQLRADAGGLIDLLLRQGEAVDLPEIGKPLRGLAQGGGAKPSLFAALESAVQLLDATDRHGFAQAVRRHGDVDAARAAERLYESYRRSRGQLYTHLAAVEALRDDVGATLQYARCGLSGYT